MNLHISILALVLGGVQHGTCSWAGLLGPSYPAPRDVHSNSSAVTVAWTNFTSSLEASIAPKGGTEAKFPGLANFTFSIGMFSVNDPSSVKVQYHHTGKDVEKSAVGVTAVDGNSVYRVASVSKAFTAYLLLIELGSDYWTRAVSEFVPDLVSPTNVSNMSAGDSIRKVDWRKVTLGSLAAHVAGITRNPAPYANDILTSLSQKDALAQGLPPLTTSIFSPCQIRAGRFLSCKGVHK
ncbi:MAG: hypothetical protein M1835_006671 [Candelina submexicana]|nr:MAG: hypothetical protein M1835_006671 [Candelina submexicana]